MTYSIALVQNQSEMAHYGYADARPLLEGYDVHLLTGDNVDGLPGLLAKLQVDALVLGSNALNDRDILKALNSETFADCVGAYLDAGRGVLCLQQLGLAMRAGPSFECLPNPLNTLRPIVPASGDPALTSAEFAFGSNAARHVALGYPHPIDPEGVRAHAAGFRSLPGLYWHYLSEAALCDWDELIVDRSAEQPRPLVLAAKESAARRVVVSALPLDWQKQQGLFTNLLVYVIEGRHNLATVHTAGEHDGDYHYLCESLRAQRIPFGEYALPLDAERAAANIASGIHSTLLLAPGTDARGLPDVLGQAVSSGVRHGRLRLVDIGPGVFGSRSMSIVSRELRPQRLLEVTELQIQTELRSGYIDDSFWGHVETLQTLETLPRPDRAGGTVDYSQLQDVAFGIARNHERDGSYDEIFGPTCALYWLRARYLGTESREAQSSAAWLRRALARYDPEDRTLAYLMFASLGCLSDADRQDLERAATSLELSQLSETKLVQLLRACTVAELSADVVAAVSRALVDAQREDGVWLDLTTTATATSALLSARTMLAGDDLNAGLIAQIDSVALGAVVYILRGLARSEASTRPHPYPWDGKAGTTVKCLQAWLQFEELQDLPVFDIIEGLRRSDVAAKHYASNRTALGVLQATNEENAALRALEASTRQQLEMTEADLATARSTIKTQKLMARIGKIGLGALALTLYFVVALLVGAVLEERGDLRDAFRKGILDGWGIHSLAAIPLLLAFVRYVRRRGGDEPSPPA